MLLLEEFRAVSQAWREAQVFAAEDGEDEQAKRAAEALQRVRNRLGKEILRHPVRDYQDLETIALVAMHAAEYGSEGSRYTFEDNFSDTSAFAALLRGFVQLAGLRFVRADIVPAQKRSPAPSA